MTRSIYHRQFARRLRFVRLSRHMSQHQLALAAGTRDDNIFRYESGRSLPGLPMISRLAEALNVPTETIYVKNPRRQRAG